MDVLITVTLRVSTNNLSTVADAIHSAINRVVDNANFNKDRKDKINTILEYQATQIKPNSTIRKDFTFPNDLDTIKSVT